MVVTDPKDPSKQLTLDVNKLIIPMVDSNTRSMRYAALANENEIDITEIDDFLQMVEGKARHYPPALATVRNAVVLKQNFAKFLKSWIL